MSVEKAEQANTNLVSRLIEIEDRFGHLVQSFFEINFHYSNPYVMGIFDDECFPVINGQLSEIKKAEVEPH